MSDPASRAANRQITLVCQWLTEPARAGRLVGRVEVVVTGEIVSIRDTTELTELVRRLSGDDDDVDGVRDPGRSARSSRRRPAETGGGPGG